MKPLSIFLFLLIGSTEILAQDADSLFALGRRLMLSSKKDSAELIMNQGIALCEKNRNDSTLLKLYLLKANLMALKNDNRIGLTYLVKAAPLYTSSTPYLYREQYNSIGGLLYRN